MCVDFNDKILLTRLKFILNLELISLPVKIY